MRADRLLCRFLGSHIECVHRSRMRALLAAVVALIRGGEINPSPTRSRDRHDGEGEAWHQTRRPPVRQRAFSAPIELRFLPLHSRTRRHPRSAEATGHGRLDRRRREDVSLAELAPCSGRAVVIYAETHPLSKYTNPRVESRFLRTLRSVLPPGCKPIVVTDAGFRAPWLRRVVALGWDYVARVRGRVDVRPIDAKQWVRFDELHRRRPLSHATSGTGWLRETSRMKRAS